MVEQRALFRRHQRLLRTLQFRVCYDFGRRVGDQHLLLFGVNRRRMAEHPEIAERWIRLLPQDASVIRLGLSVSRRHGNAVHRNRKKRRLREAFRLVSSDLPAGYDLVAVPRHGDQSTVADYRESFLRLAGRLADQRRSGGRGRSGGSRGRRSKPNGG